ncbi:hypothetical protein N431DRAFT_492163 [Stipitochalara longipes BDJ]|nr:hypothetical protein N431DRAFT_492163 [Stipitochalara longipes BDJ]
MNKPNTDGPLKDDFIFEYGDLTVKFKLDGEEKMGKVSTSAMAMASPVWKKFIYPPFPQIESDESAGTLPIKELDFTEDDATALLVLLRVAHLRFKQIPASPSYELLVKLAVLCDQYDCVDLVRPWFHTWFWGEAFEALKDGQEGWLFIAWVFGREITLDSLALKLVKELSLDKYGKANFGIKDIDSLPIPQSLIENILKVRIATIDQLLELPYNCIGRYEMRKIATCKERLHKDTCDAISYGCILKGVENADLWPRLKAQDVHVSVSQLASTIKSFKILCLQNHSECLGINDMKSSATRILSGIESPLLESHRQLLKARNQENHEARVLSVANGS